MFLKSLKQTSSFTSSTRGHLVYIHETDNVHNNETAERRCTNWGTHEDTYIINSESAIEILLLIYTILLN